MANPLELIVTILAGFGQSFGIRAGTEAPPYSVVERIGQVEIRHYGPRLAAEARGTGTEESARNAGFRKVAGYIFGANRSKASIAMTAPVAQAAEGRSQSIAMTAPVAQAPSGRDGWTIQFFMPARYTRATLPEPTDPDVRIVDVPAQDYAVLRFSGLGRATVVAARTAELQASLQGSRWRAEGAATTWYYDPPWAIPMLRRNEVAIAVSPRAQPTQ